MTPQTDPDLHTGQILWHILHVPKNISMRQILFKKGNLLTFSLTDWPRLLNLQQKQILWHMENMPKNLPRVQIQVCLWCYLPYNIHIPSYILFKFSLSTDLESLYYPQHLSMHNHVLRRWPGSSTATVPLAIWRNLLHLILDITAKYSHFNWYYHDLSHKITEWNLSSIVSR